jgi:hypothetical protein
MTYIRTVFEWPTARSSCLRSADARDLQDRIREGAFQRPASLRLRWQAGVAVRSDGAAKACDPGYKFLSRPNQNAFCGRDYMNLA